MDTQTETNSELLAKLRPALLALRIGIGIVFVMWTIDKFANPAHAAKVFEKFYSIGSLAATMSYLVGALQAGVLIAFLCGAFRSVTYLAVLIMHAVSTLSSYQQYFDPWTYPHLLFFAAIPMLSACYALWSLRSYDSLLSVDAYRSKSVT